MTDELLKEKGEISTKENLREQDVLLATGEQITIAKLSMCLSDLGYKAISLLGWQVPIITDSNYGDANVIDIKTDRILKELKEEKIVIIAGFQGVTRDNNITTLGRNGSDTTAIAIAAALEEKECYIFTDTNGVYDKDPYKYKNAKKLDYISYEDMEGMAKNGAKVLHDRCVVLAKKYGVKIIVKNTFNDEIGTIVGK